ncbi:uncharacterized protein LOC8067156 [Sorghum bicolor]|uniref:Uncharacterized protein n=1 Tax=Sorghum bicolor TaxID=4558 RepID=C5YR60_SORBI|nr:uncharacterized protein LOC8067156 [Sorghum bicolor]EES16586.1 hypothetical protein SORBI_3008G024900 [Sorghum bicolor]|eukprot:XP_002442748.1 uncharacterized protein LOC8067156 [Sorghum bicolor]
MGARKLQGRSSEGQGMMLKTTKTKKNLACASEGYGILKAKKEALAAVRLLRFKRVPGGMDIWMDHWRETKAKAAAEEEEAARPVKERKRVVKQRLPKALIHLMVARPFRTIEDLTPLQLSKRSHEFRQLYALTTFVDAKVRGYEQALIHQYNAQGYAEDEIEVDASVVEN